MKTETFNNLLNVRIDSDEPVEARKSTEALQAWTNERTESVLPRCIKASTETPPPTVNCFATLIELPHRANDLKDIDEETKALPSAETPAENLPK